ncbi:MAG TPA: flagellar biosynthesis protein FlhF [Limnobacter sp.]|uniref:flagellar biosynthesis protein FlhF n=1 Tax=Limnobacter sp. TaxID=2003368 RepID=UPI002E35D382|nr:flagellar biosynthesis protein FlhF [Limnobacter sp.]HEX5484380.1 flagellar biosynthesis protein FlhF [Limnobacter sp.]
MKLKKFIAPTTREALQKLRSELGDDAIILSTKQTAAGTEVLAASSEEIDSVTSPAQAATGKQQDGPPSWRKEDRAAFQKPAAPALAQAPVNRVAEARRDAVAAQLEAQRAMTQYGDQTEPFAPVRLPSAAPERVNPVQEEMLNSVGQHRARAASETMMAEQAEVLAEIKQMRQLLKDQMNMLQWRDSLEKNPQRAELWNHLTQSGFSPLFARTVVDKLPDGYSDTQVHDWVSTVLMRNLPVTPASNDIVEQGGLYALVGPTGVGKTTTTAKLAARCVVKYGADSLGLITTDSYRVGAQDQLRIYGKILGVQVYTAQTNEDLQQLRNSMQRKRLILIDTVGMGQRDRRVGEQSQMLIDSHAKRVILLNATSQPETLDDVVRHYKNRGLDGAILTKLDEAIKLGGVLDVVMRHKLNLHYIATGQRVPEDLFAADPKVLVHRALKVKPTQAFQASDEEMKWKMTQV